MLDEIVTLRLPRYVVLQIVDGLNSRLEAWESTHKYLENGEILEFSSIEECRDSEEAESIANFYKDIITELHKQSN